MADGDENQGQGSLGNRRAFFREGFSRVLEPIGQFLSRRLSSVGPRTLLRPPGALAEADFLSACHRCGDCVRACPANAIFSLTGGDPELNGTPVIDPERSPCVVCSGLDCMTACPTGALLPVDASGLIRMGIARVDADACVRAAGEGCTECVGHCPIGADALRIDGSGPPRVLEPGCVGCGVCQFVCPTQPRSIVVEPTW